MANWADQPLQRCFLAEVPLEMLLQICEALAGDAHSLARLGQTCRALQTIVVRVLYRVIVDREGQRVRALALLARLANKPTVAQHVRSVVLLREDIHPTPALAQSFAGVFRNIMRRLFGTLETVDMPGNHIAPMIVMGLACLSPNLGTLEVAASPAWARTDCVLQKAQIGNSNRTRVTGARITLPNLTTFSVRCPIADTTSTSVGVNLHKWDGLFHAATNLRHLTLSHPLGGTSLTARLPHLTTLILTNAFLCKRGLHHLTRASTQLLHFEYTHNPKVSYRRWPSIAPAEVLECLAPCKGTLQKLRLVTADPAQFAGVRPFPLVSGLGGGGFTALRQVAIDYPDFAHPWDVNGLVNLLRGCTELKGLFLMGVEEFQKDEFERWARVAVGGVMWPQFSFFQMQTKQQLDPGRMMQVFTDFYAQLVNDPAETDAWRMGEAGVVFRVIPATVDTGPFADW